MADANDVSEMMSSAWKGDVERLRALLNRDSTLANCVGDAEGTTPVHYAAAKSLPALELLLEHGADPAVVGNDGNALHLAVWFGNRDTVVRLLDAGVQPNATAAAGETPLHYAALRGYDEIGETLLKVGVEVNAQTTHGRTDMFNESPPVVGETPLHLAAAEGRVSFVRLLLAYGADRKVAARDGQLAIHWAARHRRDEVVELLK